jgi:hypothetical protein
MAPLMGQVRTCNLPQTIELIFSRRLLELQLQSSDGHFLLPREHGLYRASETTTAY